MGVRKKIITDKSEIEKLLQQAEVCHLSMIDLDGTPYTIAMNFGFRDNCFYFHSGPGGKKLELLEKNPNVCISLAFDTELFVRHENVACSYSMLYKSVVAKGKAVFVVDPDEKREQLNIVMKQYTQKEDYKYNDPAVNNVVLFKVECTEITAHHRGVM
ncbi:MAG: pyridoxamine 5'-phosphate oxidase family protein [Bacteroidetes bacterium]|nr:pyridoxamine 5'-phosphate oxidase family protein [Bacteroidota bacterium]MBL6962891.1 pyridoxamine 5'-phosphate oxidase family protein [Bacteroidota bacterium]